MASKIHNGILILTLILFASCRTQKPAPRPAPPKTMDFPTANIPLPVMDFNFMLPALQDRHRYGKYPNGVGEADLLLSRP